MSQESCKNCYRTANIDKQFFNKSYLVYEIFLCGFHSSYITFPK